VPWKANRPVDQKMEFVVRLLRGERMTDLCAEYGISRKTGHAVFNRYEAYGAAGLEEQSRAPKHIPHRTSPELVAVIVAARQKHPTWGPKKLKKVLEGELGHPLPAASTIGGVLRRNGLPTQSRQRRRYISRPTGLTEAHAANDVWCADYKGQFRLGDSTYCYPLTITDQRTRFLLACEGMSAIREDAAREVFESVFRERGLPLKIRTDNGVPFATTGLGGLSKLAVYWMLLGVAHERIRPAHPEENGRHERMHRTLKLETTRPAGANLLQQQERFDAFRRVFNEKRPHEALNMDRPADVYATSLRPYPATVPEPRYPVHDDTLYVTKTGFVRVPNRGTVYLSTALANQPVGIREEKDGRWLVSFMECHLGHVHNDRTFVPLPSVRAEG
jgi:transposase InsO family protein